MKELETLLARRWVLKAEDRELYYRIPDSIGEIRKYASEKMGCQVIENALLFNSQFFLNFILFFTTANSHS